MPKHNGKRCGSVSLEDVVAVTGQADMASHGREYVTDCPFCGKPKHLYIDVMTGRWICQRCKASGTRRDLLGDELEKSPQRDQMALLLEKLLAIKLRNGDVSLDEPPTGDIWQFADGKAVQYLRSRGLTDNDINFYGIRLGVEYLSGTVVVVDRNRKDKPLYWTARAYLNDRQRYRNPFGVRKQTVFNLERAQEVSPSEVVICEGVFSAMRTGRHAVALYGSQMTTEQRHLLLAADFRRYYVATEPDVTTKIALGSRGKRTWEVPAPLALAKELVASVRGDVFLVDIPVDADPGDLGPARMTELVQQATPVTRFDIMKEKMACLQRR